MKLLLIVMLFFLTNCGKSKTVLICGDHVCLNKSEAEQYFEENLSIEVKIIDKNILTNPFNLLLVQKKFMKFTKIIKMID